LIKYITLTALIRVPDTTDAPAEVAIKLAGAASYVERGGRTDVGPGPTPEYIILLIVAVPPNKKFIVGEPDAELH
jgi:hypothetical protein